MATTSTLVKTRSIVTPISVWPRLIDVTSLLPPTTTTCRSLASWTELVALCWEDGRSAALPGIKVGRRLLSRATLQSERDVPTMWVGQFYLLIPALMVGSIRRLLQQRPPPGVGIAVPA